MLGLFPRARLREAHVWDACPARHTSLRDFRGMHSHQGRCMRSAVLCAPFSDTIYVAILSELSFRPLFKFPGVLPGEEGGTVATPRERQLHTLFCVQAAGGTVSACHRQRVPVALFAAEHPR